MSWKHVVLNEALKKAQTTVGAARGLVHTRSGQQVVKTARVVVQNGPTKELAMICGRAGMAGAIVDGGMGAVQAVKAVREGRIDNAGAAKHVIAETGCGFVTSASGTAGTLAILMITGSMGPLTLVGGMGASMGSRYIYRKVVGETLPGAKDSHNRDDEDHTHDFEEIGPRPSDD